MLYNSQQCLNYWGAYNAVHNTTVQTFNLDWVPTVNLIMRSQFSEMQ